MISEQLKVFNGIFDLLRKKHSEVGEPEASEWNDYNDTYFVALSDGTKAIVSMEKYTNFKSVWNLEDAQLEEIFRSIGPMR